ncbi:hypothetical protein FACS1894113_1000 [Alphaproteobacteria bacterium]|nr:hypothetical protein FACS1894113_1000 [Alphaproteobacteria bacterium]
MVFEHVLQDVFGKAPVNLNNKKQLVSEEQVFSEKILSLSLDSQCRLEIVGRK